MESVMLERITVVIHGLTKDGESTRAVEQALSGVPGVSRVYINTATEMAYIEYDPSRVTHAQLLQAIEGVGLRPGEVEIRSVGSLGPLPARRRAVHTGAGRIEHAEPSILADPPAVGLAALIRSPAPGEVISGRRRLTPGSSIPALAAEPARSTLVRGSARSWHRLFRTLWGLARPLSGPSLLRLRIVAGAVVLAVLVGSSIWLALAGQEVPKNTFSVEVGPSGFNPVAVVIPAGKPATLRVRHAGLASTPGGASHQFAIGELGINVKLEPGETTVINLMPLQPATYHYVCDICCGGSGEPAMQGALIVH